MQTSPWFTSGNFSLSQTETLCPLYSTYIYIFFLRNTDKKKIISALSAAESKLQDLHGYQGGLSMGYHGLQWGTHF